MPGITAPLQDVQHGSECGGGVNRHPRRVLGVDQLQQVVRQRDVRSDVDGQTIDHHLLEKGQDLDAGRPGEQHVRGRRGPTVLVVGIELIGLGQPLLQEPPSAAVDAVVERQAVGDGAAVDELLAGDPQVLEAAGRIVRIEPGLHERRPVVVQDRVGEVEGHGLQRPPQRVVGRGPREEVVQVVVRRR